MMQYSMQVQYHINQIYIYIYICKNDLFSDIKNFLLSRVCNWGPITLIAFFLWPICHGFASVSGGGPPAIERAGGARTVRATAAAVGPGAAHRGAWRGEKGACTDRAIAAAMEPRALRGHGLGG